MKFRRKSAVPDEASEVTSDAAEASDQTAGPDTPAHVGPFDADDLPDDGVERVDLGSLLIAPVAGR